MLQRGMLTRSALHTPCSSWRGGTSCASYLGASDADGWAGASACALLSRKCLAKSACLRLRGCHEHWTIPTTRRGMPDDTARCSPRTVPSILATRAAATGAGFIALQFGCRRTQLRPVSRQAHENRTTRVSTEIHRGHCRAGVEPSGESCQDTCNGRSAGLGRRPSSKTALPELVDAYFWLFPQASLMAAQTAVRALIQRVHATAHFELDHELAGATRGQLLPAAATSIGGPDSTRRPGFHNGPGMTQASVEAAAARTVNFYPRRRKLKWRGCSSAAYLPLIAGTGLVSFATRLRGARSPVTIDTPLTTRRKLLTLLRQ